MWYQCVKQVTFERSKPIIRNSTSVDIVANDLFDIYSKDISQNHNFSLSPPQNLKASRLDIRVTKLLVSLCYLN